MLIDGIRIETVNFDADKDELARYVAATKERVPDVSSIKATLREDGTVKIDWTAHCQKFERIRRITGYLVGTTDRWNNSKQAEEKDRVKHL